MRGLQETEGLAYYIRAAAYVYHRSGGCIMLGQAAAQSEGGVNGIGDARYSNVG